MKPDFKVMRDKIALFCQKHSIKKLAIFGSALRDTFGPESDIDILVEFLPNNIPTLFDMAGMELELSNIFSGRRVDLRTKEDLSCYFRDQILREAEVQYATG
jgi:predicted nucleotidyltransferase